MPRRLISFIMSAPFIQTLMPSPPVPRPNLSLDMRGAGRSKEGDLRPIPSVTKGPNLVNIIVLELPLHNYPVVKDWTYSFEGFTFGFRISIKKIIYFLEVGRLIEHPTYLL